MTRKKERASTRGAGRARQCTSGLVPVQLGARPVAVYPRLQQRPDEDTLGGPRVLSCPQSLSVLRDEPFQPQRPSLVLSSELKAAAVGPGLMKWGTFEMVLLITLKA